MLAASGQTAAGCGGAYSFSCRHSARAGWWLDPALVLTWWLDEFRSLPDAGALHSRPPLRLEHAGCGEAMDRHDVPLLAYPIIGISVGCLLSCFSPV